jgi:hypothetical protein
MPMPTLVPSEDNYALMIDQANADFDQRSGLQDDWRGTTISFKVNGTVASETAEWKRGGSTELNLSSFTGLNVESPQTMQEEFVSDSVPPHLVIGTAYIDGVPAPDGTVISAWIDGKMVAETRTTTTGIANPTSITPIVFEDLVTYDDNLIIVWRFDLSSQNWVFYSPYDDFLKFSTYVDAKTHHIVWVNVRREQMFQDSHLYPGLNFIGLNASTFPSATPTPTLPTPTPQYTYIGPGLYRTEILRSDLRLTLEESPYWFEGEIQVADGKTVFVEPGVEVYGDSPGNSVFKTTGSFTAVGTESQPIVFNSFFVQGSGDLDGDKLTIVNVNGEMFGANYRSEGEVTDSILLSPSFADFHSLIVKRNVFRKSPLNNGYAGNFTPGGSATKLELVNNCFSSYALSVWSWPSSYLIEHNTFDATVYEFQKSKWFKIPSSTMTEDISLTNNYWYGSNDWAINDLLEDANTQMDLEARFITSPSINTPHRDTPDCIVD